MRDLECRIDYGRVPLYVEQNGTIWVSQSYKLLKSQDGGKTYQKVAQFSPRLIDKWAGIFRISERLLRTGFSSLQPLANGNILAVVKNYIVLLQKKEVAFRVVFDIPRGSRPLNICLTPNGKIYFGEYFSNSNRDCVRIFGSDDGGEHWDPVHTFPKGSIRHVHGIYFDPYREGCWVLTGDQDEECKLMFTSDDFHDIEVVIQGGQNIRAVGVIPLPEGLVVPMDSPLETSYIQWVEPKTGKITRTCKMPGSALAVGRAGDYLLVSSGVEPSQVNLSKDATIFISKNGFDWQILHSRKKDFWPGKLFQYGLFRFPVGPNPGDKIYAYGISISREDNCMLSWSRNDIEAFLVK